MRLSSRPNTDSPSGGAPSRAEAAARPVRASASASGLAVLPPMSVGALVDVGAPARALPSAPRPKARSRPTRVECAGRWNSRSFPGGQIVHDRPKGGRDVQYEQRNQQAGNTDHQTAGPVSEQVLHGPRSGDHQKGEADTYGIDSREKPQSQHQHRAPHGRNPTGCSCLLASFEGSGLWKL
ncbi:hypothetical protein I553_8978 [Mycobacterium xenopi 4042]|uniref:Uncharacterized protein n=1 Tax=Mycobacterium xenopi 4042 TaxID=1299334 RepID=X8APM5_MYCXE|nr:hypothetical protein I553_8978 [Mycobacterium xenopi 4042]